MLLDKYSKKYNVFIDMDGIVSNIVEAVCLHTGFSYSEWPRGQHDIDFIPGFSFSTLPHEWWASIPKMFDADEIVAICEKRFKFENCYFLTAPCSDNYACAGGKQAWVEKYFPKYKRKVLIGVCKEACAGPNSILIDDSPKNCTNFQLNCGTAFMLPRYWNTKCVPELNAVKELKEFVDMI